MICIDYDQHLELPLGEEEMEWLDSMGIKHNTTIIYAQKICIDYEKMEDFLQIIEDFKGGGIILQRYDYGRYTLTY